MKTLRLDCSEGATKEILLNQLIRFHPDSAEFVEILKNVAIPGITIEKTIANDHVNVVIAPIDDVGHCGRHDPDEVYRLIESLRIPDTAARHALGIYDIIGEAEARAHGVPLNKIHFHEVGSPVAVAHVIGICLLADSISADRIVSTPVRIGFGTIECSHGTMSVPTPATKFLLRDIPSFVGNREGEFCTPTGAAVVKYFADDFESDQVFGENTK